MTLTIIIVAVVLMVAGLTLVTMFGAGIGDFFEVADDTASRAQIENSCEGVRQDISEVICDGYVNSDQTSFSRLSTTDENITCLEANCELHFEDGNVYLVNQSDAAGGETDDPLHEMDVTVNIEGNEYVCYEQIHIPAGCPVS